jgi:hypothetical protein
VVLEVFASGNGDEEFWYSNTPEEYVDTFAAWNVSLLGQGTFREIVVYIDDVVVGVVSPFEVVFTGGVCPGFWRPIVGHRTFDLPAYPIDLTPFLGHLRNETHQLSFRIQGQPNTLENWYVSAHLQIWLGNGSISSDTSSNSQLGLFSIPSNANITTAGLVANDNTSFSATTLTKRQHSLYSLDYQNHQSYQLLNNGSKMVQNFSQTTVFNSSLARGHFVFNLQVEQVDNPDGTVAVNATLNQSFYRSVGLDGATSLERAEVSTVGVLLIGKSSNLSQGNTSVAVSFSSPRREYTRVVSAIGHQIVSDYEMDRSVGYFDFQLQEDSL